MYQKNVKKKLVLKPSTSIICSDLGAELAELQLAEGAEGAEGAELAKLA